MHSSTLSYSTGYFSFILASPLLNIDLPAKAYITIAISRHVLSTLVSSISDIVSIDPKMITVLMTSRYSNLFSAFSLGVFSIPQTYKTIKDHGAFATNEPLALVASSVVNAKLPVMAGDVAVIVTLPLTDTVFAAYAVVESIAA